MKNMKKKLISMILILTMLTSYVPIIPLITIAEAVGEEKVVTEWTFEYTGEEQTFQVPYKGIYKVELYGAEGGDYGNYVGGKGGSTKATFLFNKNESLAINVGGKNSVFNGGGNGANSKGGGATDIRQNGKTLENRILVAGGGGAASSAQNGNPGSDTENLTTTLGQGEGTISAGSGLSIVYHTHVGTKETGGDCYTPHYHKHSTENCNPTYVYHIHDGSETQQGGCFTEPIYHTHSGGNGQTIYSNSNPGGCYVAKGHTHNAVTTCSTGTREVSYQVNSNKVVNYVESGTGIVHYMQQCPVCGSSASPDSPFTHTHKRTESYYTCGSANNTWGLGCGKTQGQIDGYTQTCGKLETTVENILWGCGKEENISVDSYELTCGKTEQTIEGYRATSGGGGGYYGGKSGAPIYHMHIGNSSNGGGCYTSPNMKYEVVGSHTENRSCGGSINLGTSDYTGGWRKLWYL